MKLPLDECVPWPLHRLLTGHDCQTAQQCGWDGLKNGELLRQSEGRFDAFVTADQSIRYQQNLTGRAISMLELSTNDLRRIQAAAALVQSAIATLQPGEYRRLGIP